MASDASVSTTRLIREHEPEEIVDMYPDAVQDAIDDAEANGRHVFAAALRAARDQARDDTGGGRGG